MPDQENNTNDHPQPKNNTVSKLGERAFGPAADSFGKEIVPLAQELGALTNIVGQRLVRGLAFAVYGMDQVGSFVREAVAKRLKNIPIEKIRDPNPRIAVPAMQALVYSMSDRTISEMFADLLAADMNADQKELTHPAFVEIIKEMTPSDAKLMKEFTTSPHIEFYPRLYSQELFHNVSAPAYSCKIKGSEDILIGRAVNNLQRLGLIEKRVEWPKLPNLDEIERRLIEICSPIVTRWQGSTELVSESNNTSLCIDKFGLYISPLGREFTAICLQSMPEACLYLE